MPLRAKAKGRVRLRCNPATRTVWGSREQVRGLCCVAAFSALLGSVAACGGSDHPAAERVGPAPISTVAYVVTECRVGPEGATGRQRLVIRHGDRDPITVREFATRRPLAADTLVKIPDGDEVPLSLVCGLFGETAWGNGVVAAFPVQTVAVSRDGHLVAFEVNEEFKPLPIRLSPEEADGIYTVRADGGDERRVHEARGVRTWTLTGMHMSFFGGLAFSPSADTLGFSVKVPGKDGGEAEEIVLLNLATGARREVTNLSNPFTCCPKFLDERKLAFVSSPSVDLDPVTARPRELRLYTVHTDGSDQQMVPGLSGLPGEVDPIYFITGQRPNVFPMELDDESREIFISHEGRLLQLTKMGGRDTGNARFDPRRERVYFVSSVDLGENPWRDCQIFSVSVTGSDLHQVTQFRSGPPGVEGDRMACLPLNGGCQINSLGVDARTGTLVFDSTCDPSGEESSGLQVFAMRPDGSGKRRLTDARGVEGDCLAGTCLVELPGLMTGAGLPSTGMISGF